MEKKIIKTGLASFGMSGQIFHAPFIKHNPNFELSAILERTKNKSSTIYPDSKRVRSFEELLAQDIELVVINTPSYLHFEMCKKALISGKHVIVEKPFTATSEEAKELIVLSEKLGLLITVYHNKRLEGDFLTVKRIIEEQALGQLQEITMQLRRFRPEPGPKKWKENNYPAAGLLYDIGAHFIDAYLHLFGKPINIKSDLQVQRKNGTVNDYFDITFEYEGFSARMISDMLTENPNYFSIHMKGSDGYFRKKGFDPQEERLASGEWNWKTLGQDFPENYGIKILDDHQSVISTEIGNYSIFYENLARAIRDKEHLLVKPQEGLTVIEIIEEIIAKNQNT